ncbi:MAG: hypothetical protein WBD22_09960 [Pyrinomonadaceae bacterium]
MTVRLNRIAIFILWLGIVVCSASTVGAQQCPNNGTPDIGRPGWPKGAFVSIYIQAGITGAARQATEDAFQYWNEANSINNSGIAYTFTTTVPTSGVGNYIIVGHDSNIIEPTSGKRVRSQAYITANAITGLTMNAGIRFDPAMTSYSAVLEAMSHEIGHPAGFDNCTGSGCNAASSVMTPVVTGGPKAFNRSFGRTTVPSGCDNSTLQTHNYPYCINPVTSSCSIWDSNTCSCLMENVGGGGGGPSPCTPYYWVYYTSWDGGQTWEISDTVDAGCW